MHKLHASLSVTMRICGRCGRHNCKSTLKCRLLYLINHNDFENFYANRGSLLNALCEREIFTSHILLFFWKFLAGIMVEDQIFEKCSPIIFLQDYALRIWMRNFQYMHECAIQYQNKCGPCLFSSIFSSSFNQEWMSKFLVPSFRGHILRGSQQFGITTFESPDSYTSLYC